MGTDPIGYILQFIRQQDKMIKDAANDRVKGTAVPGELISRAKMMEQENKLLRQEQKLMMSAWYDLHHRLLRNGSSAASNVASGAGAARGHTKAAVDVSGLKPKSWLLQQRNQLAGGILLARR